MTLKYSPPSAHQHSLPLSELVLLEETDVERGLTEEQVAERTATYGRNALPRLARVHPLRRLASQFLHPLVLVLIAAGAVSALVSEYLDAAVIAAVVIIDAAVGLVQESRAEAALSGLQDLLQAQVHVIRDGTDTVIDATGLVPGDVVLLAAGAQVPADIRITEALATRVDESPLTGESLPVGKSAGSVDPASALHERTNMLYAGTHIVAGVVKGIVVATGEETEIGAIHRLIGGADMLATPLTEELGRFTVFITIFIFILAAISFVGGLFHGETPKDMFIASVALAVGAIPEGMPAVVSVTLAIGVVRMARRGAIIRRLAAVEMLGSVTVICTDKTGTLTENRMTVQSLFTPAFTYHLTGADPAGEGLLVREDGLIPVSGDSDAALLACALAATAASDALLAYRSGSWETHGDPTDVALAIMAQHIPHEEVQVLEELRIPFTPARRFSAAVVLDTATEEGWTYVRGAPEVVLASCRAMLLPDGSTVPLDRARMQGTLDAAMRSGERIVAFAEASGNAFRHGNEDELPHHLTYVGSAGMVDPVRMGVREAIASCARGGIATKMVTGDQPETAQAVAGTLGLFQDSSTRVLLGSALAAQDSASAEDIREAAVFSRVTPDMKIQIVRALQDDSEVVAMTGDGVNDAPALRQAHVGIAMGRSGTAVARDAADIVLTDDNFATLEHAIEEGRGAIDNVIKYLAWALPTNMGEGLIILVAALLGTPLPILPSQILWVNLTTAVFLGMTLAIEAKDANIMNRPPRDIHGALISGEIVRHVIFVGVLVVASTGILFWWERGSGLSEAQARTAAVNLLILVEILCLLSYRTERFALQWSVLRKNIWMLAGIAVQLLIQGAFTYWPPLAAAFGAAAVPFPTWLKILAVGFLTGGAVELEKHLLRPHAHRFRNE